jgi:hypothetical protein
MYCILSHSTCYSHTAAIAITTNYTHIVTTGFGVGRIADGVANPWTVGAGAEPEDDKWAIAKTAVNKPIAVEELDDEAADAAEDAAKAAEDAAKAAADAAEEAAKAAEEAAKNGALPTADPTADPTVVAGDTPTEDPGVAMLPTLDPTTSTAAAVPALPVLGPAPATTTTTTTTAVAQVAATAEPSTAASAAPVQIWTGGDLTLQSGPVFAASAALVSHLCPCIFQVLTLQVVLVAVLVVQHG